jgi:hypothetical protein
MVVAASLTALVAASQKGIFFCSNCVFGNVMASEGRMLVGCISGGVAIDDGDF